MLTDEQLAEIRAGYDATSAAHAIERYEATKNFHEQAEWWVELLLAEVERLRADANVMYGLLQKTAMYFGMVKDMEIQETEVARVERALYELCKREELAKDEERRRRIAGGGSYD